MTRRSQFGKLGGKTFLRKTIASPKTSTFEQPGVFKEHMKLPRPELKGKTCSALI